MRLFPGSGRSAPGPARRRSIVTRSQLEGHTMMRGPADSRFPLAVVLAILVSASVGSDASADTTLRWKFAEGQKQSYLLTQKMDITMEIMGKMVESSFT